MKIYGLIGARLDYSFSRSYFTEKFSREHIEAKYNNFELKSIDELNDIIRTETSLCGFNVTIPYKEQIIPYLTKLTPTADAIGAVNCVKVRRNANGVELYGDNTDCIGFKISLLNFLDGKQPNKAYILGTGGAAKAVAYVLQELLIPYQFVSRNSGKDILTYDELKKVMQPGIVFINTTPLGTWPNVDCCPPLDYDALDNTDFLYDLTYNPAVTLFMENGKKRGAQVINGAEMLTKQAEAAWTFWNE